ncbi:alpha/beta hydrolase [Actinospica durhamensis]|uniref:Alpha/beta hydrolase n=2 Tax=Actinospica durhamensis TaxID=1508375 RepID=A0A941EVB0_9ACTN|nr:alpha/beta hydrolase [Actinospica durhamensis]
MTTTGSPKPTTTPTAPAFTATPATPAAKSRTIELPGGLPLTIQEFGENTEGTAVLVLHAGSGPRTVAGFSAALSEHVYVITPIHPGFDGTARPDGFDSVADLATAYLDLLDALDLTGVMVVGNSVGGWIASEMALRDNHRRIGSLVLVNAVGIHAYKQENRVVDVRTLDPADLGKLSFANAAFRPDFSTFSDEQRAAAAANQRTLAVYGGEHFVFDPKLRARLHRVSLPVLVVWGEQDGVAPLGYGRGFARAFPHGRFAPIPEAGHFPQLEQTGATLAAISDFVDQVVKPDEQG